MQITYKGRSSWVFVYIWLIILLFSSHLTVPWTLSKMHVQLFSKIDPTTEASRSMSILIMRWGLLPFWSPRSLPAPVQTGKSSWTSGVSTLSLLFSRAQLLPLALSLECLGENKVSVLLHLTNTTCLAQGPICLGSLGDYLEVLWQCVFGLSGEKSQPVTEEQVCEPGAVRPHKPKHRSLQPGKVYCSVMWG